MTSTPKSHFPLPQVFAFAIQQIRMRLSRTLLVLVGVTTAIAFTNLLLTLNALLDALPAAAVASAEGLTRVPVFRYLWIAVALLIATAGMLNTIAMSVTERIQEIGTLKCLGCRNIHVVEIYLIETGLLGFAGGILGSLAGYGAALLGFAATVGWNYLSWNLALGVAQTMFVTAAISVGLAFLAGIIPVWIAARTEPAEAMRYEI